MIKFDIFRKSEMRPSDVSKLLKVSRVACSLWMNGHSQPHRLIEKRVVLLITAAKAAYSVGDLPVSEDVPRAQRFEKISEAVAAQLSGGLASIAE